MKAIVMDGYDETEVVACFAGQKMDSLLQKPPTLLHLRQTNQQLIDGSLHDRRPS
jgi:hypothetical protein